MDLRGEIWNPWHGCSKYSEGCANCYVYRRDTRVGRDASQVVKNSTFDLPIQKKRNGEYKLPGGIKVFCCMTSDFFLDTADGWRADCWKYMKERSDIEFTIITKRIVRFETCIPDDWGEGYPNVSLVCTVENQKQCDIRLPVLLKAKIAHKSIACEPLLGKIDMRKYLDKSIEVLLAGGESGETARVCDFEWILDLRQQAIDAGIPFYFKQTGAKFLKNGKLYSVPRAKQHIQAQKAGLNT